MTPTPFEVTPAKLVYGGAALGYHAGHPVLVPGALPDERVEVEVAREAKGMIHARLLRVITPSAQRIMANCPYFGRCGGCHYQHFDATGQTKIKREILRETLRRIGRIDWQSEIGLHAADPWHYRNQAQLKIGHGREGGTAIGFFAADSHRLVPVEACPISSPRLNTLLAAMLRPEWSQHLAGFTELDLFADDRDEEVILTFRGRCDDPESLARDCLTRLDGVVTVAFEDGQASDLRGAKASARQARYPDRGRARTIFGKPSIAYRVGSWVYEVSAGSFFQASRFLLPDLVAKVTDERGGELVIDLYAGVGLFTLPLAQRFRQVIAVEANASAAADLNRNVHAAGSKNVRAVHAKTADFLRRFAQGRPDLIVLDPPRSGADAETLRSLTRLGPRQLCYVSCQPPTFARDIAFLTCHGYKLESVDMYDLFPQTFHIESIAKLARS